MIHNKMVYGDLVKGTPYPFIRDYKGLMVEVNPNTVGQFIGLKDKHCFEIYENDIICHERRSLPYSDRANTAMVKCIVLWQNGEMESDSDKDNPSSFNENPKFVGRPIDESSKESRWGYDWSEFHDCEVIGNVHQNPELL